MKPDVNQQLEQVLASLKEAVDRAVADPLFLSSSDCLSDLTRNCSQLELAGQAGPIILASADERKKCQQLIWELRENNGRFVHLLESGSRFVKRCFAVESATAETNRPSSGGSDYSSHGEWCIGQAPAHVIVDC